MSAGYRLHLSCFMHISSVLLYRRFSDLYWLRRRDDLHDLVILGVLDRFSLLFLAFTHDTTIATGGMDALGYRKTGPYIWGKRRVSTSDISTCSDCIDPGSRRVKTTVK